LNNFTRRLKRIPPVWRWTVLAILFIAAVALVWFLFPRSSPSQATAPRPPLPRPALGRTVSFSAYEDAISKALSQVQTAQAATGADRDNAIKSAVATLSGVEGASVSPTQQTSAPSQIDNSALIEALSRDNPNLEGAEQSLAALSDSLTGQSSGRNIEGTLDGQASTSELRQVLSDPAFNYERDLSPLQRLAHWLAGGAQDVDPGDTLWRWATALIAALASGVLTFLASERLGNVWLRLGLSTLVGLFVGTIFYTGLQALDVVSLAIAAAGVVIAAVAAGLMVTGVYRVSAPPARPRSISELAAVLGMSAAEARAKAEDAAQAGDYRSAIRYRCLAVLLTLDEAGKLTFDRAATNREYLFRAPGPLQNELQPLLSRFDAIWYGNAPATAEEWTEYDARAAHVEAVAGSEQRRAA
jgi:hypothetical protein